MCAGVVGAVVAKVVYVAHLEFLDAFEFVGVIVDDWVNALAVAIAGDCGGFRERCSLGCWGW